MRATRVKSSSISSASRPKESNQRPIDLSFFQGWPNVAFVQQPRSEILLGLFVAITSYLLPVFISIAIYILLIINRKKVLKNRVHPFTSGVQPAEDYSVAGEGKQNGPLPSHRIQITTHHKNWSKFGVNFDDFTPN